MDEGGRKRAPLGRILPLAEMADHGDGQHGHGDQPQFHPHMDKHIVNVPGVEVCIRILQVQSPPLIGPNSQQGIHPQISQPVPDHGQPFRKCRRSVWP